MRLRIYCTKTIHRNFGTRSNNFTPVINKAATGSKKMAASYILIDNPKSAISPIDFELKNFYIK